jgi:subtilisin family serine protease
MAKLIKKIVVTFLVLSFFVIPVAGATGGVQAQGSRLAPLLIPESAEIIPDQYIVVYKSEMVVAEAEESIRASVAALGGEVQFMYGAALNGYSAYLPGKALEAARADPAVEYVEADAWVHLYDDGVEAQAVQNGATWGLDRSDQRNLPLSNTYTYTTTASNVHVYILDTGINSTHTLFGGRATKDFDAIGDGQNGNDCAGHGTHVAGTIGSSTYGVAKGVKLHAVRVLDCFGSGSFSQVIAGVNWVTAHHLNPAVANMSLGSFGSYAPLESAVQNSINDGVTYVIAAGNDGVDACTYTPARLPAAITVGSTTSTDARSSFSNYGTCLDIFSPGSDITSTWIGSNTATNTISGTSMAAPHVAGVAALYLATHTSANPAAVRNALVSNATPNKVTNPGAGSINRLLYSRFSTSTVPVLKTPSGTVTDKTPTYKWTPVTGATKYQYQLMKGTTSVYSKIVNASVCTSSLCSNTPTTTLSLGAYKWRVRAMVGGAWKAWSAYKNFSIQAPSTNPQAGFWESTTGDEFYVTVDQANVDDFAIYVSVSGCGVVKITRTSPLVPIVNENFSFSGSFYANGTFDTATSAHGTDGLSSYFIPGCGTVSGGPWDWTATWQDSSQPLAILEDEVETIFNLVSEAPYFHIIDEVIAP